MKTEKCFNCGKLFNDHDEKEKAKCVGVLIDVVMLQIDELDDKLEWVIKQLKMLG